MDYLQQLMIQNHKRLNTFFMTLCVDLIGTFIEKDPNQSIEYIYLLKQNKQFFHQNYILVKNSNSLQICRCANSFGKECICDHTLYKIRPYVKEFMNSTRLYYETICFSELTDTQTLMIIHHLDSLLTKPPRWNLRRGNLPMRLARYTRINYFQLRICDKKLYLQVDDLNT